MEPRDDLTSAISSKTCQPRKTDFWMFRTVPDGELNSIRVYWRDFPPIMGDFVDAVIEERDPIVSGASARTTIELINAIIFSGIRHI